MASKNNSFNRFQLLWVVGLGWSYELDHYPKIMDRLTKVMSQITVHEPALVTVPVDFWVMIPVVMTYDLGRDTN